MSHVHNTPITELPADDLPDEEVVLSVVFRLVWLSQIGFFLQAAAKRAAMDIC